MINRAVISPKPPTTPTRSSGQSGMITRLRPLPAQDTELSAIRLRMLVAAVILLFAALLGRLWYLQIVQGETMKAKAESNRRRRVRDSAPRGLITDINGKMLAMNEAQFSVFIDPGGLPKKKEDRELVYQQLAPLIGVSLDELKKTIDKNRVGSNAIPVAEGVSQQILARIMENRSRLPGIDAGVEPVRRYPQGPVAAHLLGHIAPIKPEELADENIKKRGYRSNDDIGRDGVERAHDELLCGQPGGVFYEIDAKGRRQREIGREDPTPGATLRLNLNLEVQKAAESALAGMYGAAVAIDPRDGSVIALASAPTFDPNLYLKRPLSQEEYETKVKPFGLNRAIQSASPPGSTFKIITSAAGLAEGAISPNTWMYCSGGMQVGKRYFKCHSSHGDVNLRDALAASCDVFYYHVALDVKAERVAAWAEKYGLGSKTGIDLPGEKGGNIPTPEKHALLAAKLGNPDTRWYPGQTANMSIGQGEVQTTPLQMALAVGAVANGGTVWEPHIVKEALDSDGKVTYRAEPKANSKLGLKPDQIAAIQNGLRAAVGGSRGTAHSASLPGIAVAGKTGSAELRGGAQKASHGWFICYAPYEKPTIAICIFLESHNGENYHGGANASPVARKMLAAYFKLGDAATGSGSTVD